MQALGTALLAGLVALPLAATRSAADPQATGATQGKRPRSSSLAAARLIPAIEGARRVVVGRIGQIEKLDLHSYAAKVWTEVALVSGAAPIAPGTPLGIAWEELSSTRPVRFLENDRVLVCLDLLPTASIWNERVPDPMTRRQTFAVALEGEAYLRDPSGPSLDLLSHYLALPSADRNGEAGSDFLLALIVSGEPPLALSATSRLARVENLGARLSRRGADELVRALLREDADGDLGDAIVTLIRHRGGATLEASLVHALRGRDSAAPLPKHFYAALGVVSGELPNEEEARLLASADPELRAIATRYASGSAANVALRNALSQDPSPVVRAAAIERLLALTGDAALDDALEALADDDALVRNTAARSAAALGASGVAGLRERIFAAPETSGGEDDRAAFARAAALGGLGSAGPEGRAVLVEVARTHPDEALKRLATMALGYAHEAHH